MSDTNSLIIDIIDILGIVFRNILLIQLWNVFVPVYSSQKNFQKKKKYSVIMLCLVLVISDYLVHIIPVNNVPLWVVSTGTVMLVYTFLYKKDYLIETIFSFGLYVNFRYLCYFIINSLSSYISDILMKDIASANDIESFVRNRVIFIQTFTIILFIGLLWLEVFFVKKVVRSIEKISALECAYLSVLNIAGAVLTGVFMNLAILKSDDNVYILTDEKPELLYLLPALSILIYLAELAVIYVWQKYNMYRKQSEVYFIEASDKENIRKQLEFQEKYYEDVRKVRHEMSGQMMTIRALAEADNISDLKKYIDNLEDTFKTVSIDIRTSSPVTDIVVNDNYRKAVELDIPIDIRFTFDKSWGIAEYDLSIILNNFLDNAIRETSYVDSGFRKITLITTDRDNIIVITCKNTYVPNRIKEKERRSIWHGLGLKNVEDIAARYEGGLYIDENDGIFTVSVMLKKCIS